MTDVVIASAIDAAPDWANFSVEISCPLCGYNLRGLVEPRCPECGHRSTWKALADGGNLPHPYLFEQHPEANVRSFFRTLLHSLEPITFWLRLKPAHKPNLKRLLIYWCASTAVTLSFLMVVPVIFWINYAMRVPGLRAATAASVGTWPKLQQDAIIKHYGSAAIYANLVYPSANASMLRGMIREAAGNSFVLILVAMIIAWPWLSAGAILLFREVVHQARIKPVHVLRAAIYSADAFVLLMPAVLLVGFWIEINPSAFLRFGTWIYALRALFDRQLSGEEAIVFFATALLLTLRMILATRLYLRLPLRAIWLAIISQLLILLAMIKAIQICLSR